MANKTSSSKSSAEIGPRKRGSLNPFRSSEKNAEVPPETAEVLAAKPEPKVTLGGITKRETKVHRKRVLRNKVQKAK